MSSASPRQLLLVLLLLHPETTQILPRVVQYFDCIVEAVQTTPGQEFSQDESSGMKAFCTHIPLCHSRSRSEHSGEVCLQHAESQLRARF